VDKKTLRRQALLQRNSLQKEEVRHKSREIARQLLGLPEYIKARTVFIYLSFGNEVDTRQIIERAWQEGKRVVVPVCLPEDKTLLLSELRSYAEIAPGTWNIPEPKAEHQRPVPPSEIDLAVIAGLAFDKRGYRLGYGVGYYDRFLPQLAPTCPKVALAYQFSLTDRLPAEAHDVPMDLIITEEAIYRIKA